MTSATPRPARCSRAATAAGMLALLGACAVPARVPAPAPAPAQAPPRFPAATPSATATALWHPANARLLTRWAADVNPDRVLPEYPRPQLVRARWQSLNGLWEFEPVRDSTAPPPLGRPLAQHILVPFAPEAALSGVGAHYDRVVYRRTFRRPADMAAGERLLLHFGAIDWRSTIYINGHELARHTGGYEAFTVDATDALRPTGDQELVVTVYDPTDAFGQPRGKQVSHPGGIWYTPVTGIWQSVWMEPVPGSSIDALAMTPDVAAGALVLTVRGRGTHAGEIVDAVASADGREVGRVSGAPGTALRLPVPHAHLWSGDDPFLYDLTVTLRDGATPVDSVASYFGMRSVGIVNDAHGRAQIALNGRPVFLLGPLDQGWWPDGLYTAPTDAALRSDIELMKSLGYSMVRKHIKVEPERWYYYADKLGLPIWQDMPSGWNDSPAARADFEQELRAMLHQLRDHPAIIVWVPFNEGWGQFDTKHIVDVIRSVDSTRLVNDASGWQDVGAGDIIDVHRYQGPQAMLGTPGRAAVVGEFGGLGFKVPGHAWAGDTWGYGGLYPTREALNDRYDRLIERMWRLHDTHGMSAGVYTQLSDVEVELNGLTTYDRSILKFDPRRTAAVNRGLAPYIEPELTEFTDSVRVTISQGTPTEIRFTTDGSEPTATSPVYRAPFWIARSTVVRARSFQRGAPTDAPEAHTDYRKGSGRAPARVALSSLAHGLAYQFFADTTHEPAFRMDWPVRGRVEHPDTRPGDLQPRKSGVAPVPTLAVRDTNEMFSLRFTGYVRVPRTGVYTFTAYSDDGAAMWVADSLVFGSLGQSPKTTETVGQVALQRGLHPITISYFQAYGPMALELYVEGPGMPRRHVTPSMFYHVPTVAPRARSTP